MTGEGKSKMCKLSSSRLVLGADFPTCLHASFYDPGLHVSAQRNCLPPGAGPVVLARWCLSTMRPPDCCLHVAI